MVMSDYGGARTCPCCGEEHLWEDGKDKRKYARHLELQLEEVLEDG